MYIISQSVNPHICKYLKAPGMEINLEKLTYKMNHVSCATPRPLPPKKRKKDSGASIIKLEVTTMIFLNMFFSFAFLFCLFVF